MSDSLFTPEEQSERDARMAAAVTSYGLGTKSYNASCEARESQRQREETTARYLAQPHSEKVLPLVCTCRSYRFAHPPSRHGSLDHPADWKPWQERYRLDREHNALVEKSRYPWEDN
jgi:hypothetical protein